MPRTGQPSKRSAGKGPAGRGGEPQPEGPGSRQLSALARRLLQWYRAHARDLPWRRLQDPYAIWVSEIMLQQTRVEAVVERYTQFLTRFPTVNELAGAPQAEVLAAWAGLGYYRRARQLHAAAKSIVAQHGGHLPRTAAALRLLPGFGTYTAGAVASIAHGEATPAIDGNVQRVVSRLLALAGDPSRGAAAATVEETARGLLRHGAPSEVNQALMELGATVCTPRAPRCNGCPWGDSCAARAAGAVELFPRRPPRRAALDVACYAAVLREGNRLLVRRRPEEGHNAGLWELPTTPWHGGTADAQCAGRALSLLAKELGAQWSVVEPLVCVRHTITHHRVTLVGYAVEGKVALGEGLAWATPREAQALGLTSAAGKLLRKLPPLL